MIVYGLGNPGPRYTRSRHNLGFMVADELARQHGLAFRQFTDYARAGRGDFVLVKPLVFMNCSGVVVKKLQQRSARPMLVVCDDCNLSLGRLRLRPRGSAGGHNGLVSVITALGREDFPRLRIGIGPMPAGVDLAPFVLAPFAKDEWPTVIESVARAAAAVELVRTDGLEAAMNRWNAS